MAVRTTIAAKDNLCCMVLFAKTMSIRRPKQGNLMFTEGQTVYWANPRVKGAHLRGIVLEVSGDRVYIERVTTAYPPLCGSPDSGTLALPNSSTSSAR